MISKFVLMDSFHLHSMELQKLINAHGLVSNISMVCEYHSVLGPVYIVWVDFIKILHYEYSVGVQRKKKHVVIL